MSATTHEQARALDAADELAGFRDRFATGDDPVAYLDGNSLGRPPRATLERLRRVLEEEWGGALIRSWSTGWADLPLKSGTCSGEGSWAPRRVRPSSRTPRRSTCSRSCTPRPACAATAAR
jgi:hypothetical protein